MTTSVVVEARPLAITALELEQLIAIGAPEKRLLEALEQVTLREEPARPRRRWRLSTVVKCVALGAAAALLAYGASTRR